VCINESLKLPPQKEFGCEITQIKQNEHASFGIVNIILKTSPVVNQIIVLLLQNFLSVYYRSSIYDKESCYR
jgi:hypothetical protein